MNIHTYCRLCEGSCGVLASVADGRLVSLSADPSDPVCGAEPCGTAQASVAALSHHERFRQPHRRVNGALVPVSWDEAIREIGQALSAIRGQSGARSVGLHLGQTVQRSSRTFLRSLAFGVGMGTPNIFTGQCRGAGPRLRMAELMLGHPVPLLSDLTRAHHVVLLGGDQPHTDWGPGCLGMGHLAGLRHSRRTKGTKVVVADPRKTALAEEFDQHLSIRPGTEPYLLMGMLAAAVKGGWRDEQYVRDYTTGWDELVDLLGPWSVERCAKACGIPAAKLSGVALKFGRSAMGIVHATPSTFNNAAPTTAAWAWLALHTITANTLRPGGLYDHKAAFDWHYPGAVLDTARAPRTRVAELPLLLLQAPDTTLADEILLPGEGQVRALISVTSDPARELPDATRVREALGDLDLLVCLARQPNATTALADWVLPVQHPWEGAELEVVDGPLLPRHMVRWTPAVATPEGEVRAEEAVLAEIFKAVKPGIRGSAFGTHVAVTGRFLGGADLDEWEQRLFEWATDEDRSVLDAPPHRLDRGEADRAVWRLSHEDERIHLVPTEVREVVRAFGDPDQDPSLPLWLRTTRRVDAAPDAAHRAAQAPDPGVAVHPNAGFVNGGRVRVITRYGQTEATVRHDATLREDVADLPAGFSADTFALVSGARLDPLTGTPELDGLGCRLEPLS